jgi:tetratricopeptide (TPR) repeat protein
MRTTWTPVDNIHGIELKSAMEALDRLTEHLLGQGFDLVDEGPRWYHRKFARTFIQWSKLEADDSALEALNALLREEPHNTYALVSRAYKYMIDERYPEAVITAGKALEIRPRHWLALATLGEALVRHGQLREALPYLEASLALEPSYDPPREALRFAQAKLGIPSSPLNDAAIVAVVLAFIVPIAGAIVGHVALGKIRTTHERGRGLAITAITAGWTLTVLICCACAISDMLQMK